MTKSTDTQQTSREWELQRVGVQISELLRNALVKKEEEAEAVCEYAKRLAIGDYAFKVSPTTATTD